MIKNLVTSCIRNIFRNRTTTLINIMGLVLGIGCCLTIYFKVRYELSFDRFHSNYDKIYRVVRHTKGLGLKLAEGEFEYRTGVFGALPNAVKNEIPAIKNVSSIFSIDEMVVKIPNEKAANGVDIFKLEKGTAFIQPTFFDMFDFKSMGVRWVGGSAIDALNKSNSVVISEQLASKYFPGQNPIGKTLLLFNNKEFTVNGVITDFPSNTDFPFKLFISLVSFEKLWNGFFEDWGNLSDNFQCFVMLDDANEKSLVESRIKEIYAKHASKEEAENRIFKLQPLREIHSDKRFGNFNQRVVSSETINALVSIGFFLVIIACVNYANLALAHSDSRTREVGIRKTFGSKRLYISMQFLGESFFLTLIAMNIGIILCKIIVYSFSTFIGLPADYNISFDYLSTLFTILLLLFISIVSGLYPALAISGYRPIEILRKQFQIPRKNKINFMRSMVVLQFTISLTIIMCTLLVFKQLHFIRNIDLGFNKRGVFTVYIPNSGFMEQEKLKTLLSKNPSIHSTSYSSSSPAMSGNWTDVVRVVNNQEKRIVCQFIDIDTSYVETYGLNLIAGRNITSYDSVKNILVNQQFVKELLFKNNQEAIGAEVNLFGDPKNKAIIIGVLKNYHYESMYDKVRPTVLALGSNNFRIAGVRFTLEGTNNEKPYNQIREVLKYTEDSWKSVYPNQLFEYRFVEDIIKTYHESEYKISRIITVCALISLFISCLGILGLALYTSERKSKEFAIRKINGANILNILTILSTEYTKWMAVAFLIACPIAYYTINKWLQNFAYKTGMSWWIFILSGVIAITVALLTVIWQSWRATSRNPVEALRDE